MIDAKGKEELEGLLTRYGVGAILAVIAARLGGTAESAALPRSDEVPGEIAAPAVPPPMVPATWEPVQEYMQRAPIGSEQCLKLDPLGSPDEKEAAIEAAKNTIEWWNAPRFRGGEVMAELRQAAPRSISETCHLSPPDSLIPEASWPPIAQTEGAGESTGVVLGDIHVADPLAQMGESVIGAGRVARDNPLAGYGVR